MAEMERVFAELAALTDLVNAGDSGLTALSGLVELTHRTVDAIGASFAEYGAGGGRVIAATGASAWATGRHVDPTDEITAGLLRRDRIFEVDVDEMPTNLASYLRGQGVRRMLAARSELTGQTIGTLHAYFPTEGRADPTQRAAIGFLATAASHFYADNRGLPVYADGPTAGTAAEAVAVVDPMGTVRSWNPAAIRLTGLSAPNVVGRPLFVSVPVPGQVVDRRLPDGRWIQLLATRLPGTDSRAVTMRDITDERRREQARDLFVAVTSHELRTPVTVIKGYADTLVNHWDELDEHGRWDAAQRLGQRAGELARLLDRLLSAVGDGSGLAGQAMPVPFDLSDVLRHAIDELPQDVRPAVRAELPDGLPKALGDRAILPIVLAELATNAVKYSPPGTPVEVTALADARTVGFRVADRGIGIDPGHVERAFERFWQAESGNQRRYGGVGLGLYLVRRVVERQNGWVSLRPRERGGTVAQVRLPRADLGPGEA